MAAQHALDRLHIEQRQQEQQELAASRGGRQQCEVMTCKRLQGVAAKGPGVCNCLDLCIEQAAIDSSSNRPAPLKPLPPKQHLPELAPHQLPVQVLKADGTGRRWLLVHQPRP